jgi:hypothetical protein
MNQELQPGQGFQCVGSEPTWSCHGGLTMFEYIIDTCIGIVLFVAVFAGIMVGKMVF